MFMLDHLPETHQRPTDLRCTHHMMWIWGTIPNGGSFSFRTGIQQHSTLVAWLIVSRAARQYQSFCPWRGMSRSRPNHRIPTRKTGKVRLGNCFAACWPKRSGPQGERLKVVFHSPLSYDRQEESQACKFWLLHVNCKISTSSSCFLLFCDLPFSGSG